MIRRFVASRLRWLAGASTRIANRVDPVRVSPMEIRFDKPLTPESATELARAIHGLAGARREERGAS